MRFLRITNRVSLIFATVLVCSLSGPVSFAQPKFRIPIVLKDSGTTVATTTAYFGVHPNATNCLDTNFLTGFNDHWADIFVFGTPYTSGMVEIDPPPPGQGVDLRVASLYPSGCRTGLYANIQGYTSATQVDSFQIVPQPSDATSPHPMIYSVPSVIGAYCDSLVLIGSKFDIDAGQAFNYHVNLVTTNGRFVDIPTNPDMVLLPSFKLYMYHPKTGPGAPAAVSLVSPPSGDTGDSLVTALSWTAPALADSYRVQIATDTAFSSPISDRTTTSTTLITPVLTSGTTYFWRVEVYNKYGISYYQDPPWSFTTKVVSGVAPDKPGLPGSFSISQNYPNPFNPSTTIDYSLPSAVHVQLKIYNLFGQEVRLLIDGVQHAGYHQVVFTASNLPSGIYVYRLLAGRYSGTGRMSLVK